MLLVSKIFLPNLKYLTLFDFSLRQLRNLFIILEHRNDIIRIIILILNLIIIST